MLNPLVCFYNLLKCNQTNETKKAYFLSIQKHCTCAIE